MIPDSLLVDADDPERSFDRLISKLSEEIEYHFSDFALREAGDTLNPASSRRRWIEALVSMAHDMSPAAWSRHWLESSAIAESDLGKQHEEAVRAWEERREWALNLQHLLAEEPRLSDIPAAMLRRMRDSIDAALSADRPTFDARSVPPEAAERLAARGIVCEVMRRGLQATRAEADRTIEVLDLLRLVSRHERVRTFLARCGRCYIAGLFPETVVMACSAIEQQLERIADDDAVRSVLSLAPSDKIMLGRRLLACKKIGVLTGADYRELQGAVNVRNDIIHLAPTSGASKEAAHGILVLCQRILVRLESLGRD